MIACTVAHSGISDPLWWSGGHCCVQPAKAEAEQLFTRGLDDKAQSLLNSVPTKDSRAANPTPDPAAPTAIATESARGTRGLLGGRS